MKQKAAISFQDDFVPQLFFLFQELGIKEPPKNVILHCSYLAVGSTIPHTALVKLCVFLDQLTRNLPKKAPLDLGGGFNQFLFSLFDWGDDETCFFFVFNRVEITNAGCVLQPTGCTIGWDKRCLFCSEKNLLLFVFPLWMVFLWGTRCLVFLLNEVNPDQAWSFRQEPIHVEDATFFFCIFSR